MRGVPDLGQPVPAGVAAGDATTARAGADVLAAGGSAVDAAVAAMLTACVAETVMTGLAGGGFATVWEPYTQTATVVDFFVAVPGLALRHAVAPVTEVEVRMGPQRLEYYAGGATTAVPGLPAGLAEMHRRWGRLPWADVVEPGRRAAQDGTPLSAAQSRILGDVFEAMVLADEGRIAYAPGGRLLQPGERLHHPGLARAYEILQAEGAAPFYTGDVARAIVDLMAATGGAVTAEDLAAYQVRVDPARSVDFAGYEVHGRTDLLDLLGTLARLPDGLGTMPAAERVRAWARVLLGRDRHPGTTNVVAVDAEGGAAAVTSSLGLGAGEWLPGLGIHLNSMLGEGELMRGSHPAGSRVDSMMCPLTVTTRGRLALVAGAAGGSRIRSAMVQVLTGVLAEGLSPQEAVSRPRVNPVQADHGPVLHVEPGVPEEALAAVAADGLAVERWEEAAAYFGGVSAIGPAGGAADPRRGGSVELLDG